MTGLLLLSEWEHSRPISFDPGTGETHNILDEHTDRVAFGWSRSRINRKVSLM